MENSSNPFFLHHSDNPGLILVSQPLNGENYNSWNRSMMIALSVKNKLGFINGDFPRPADDDPLLQSWIRNDHVVMSWILNCVSKDIVSSVIYCRSAKEIWQDLQDRFHQPNGTRIYQLKKDLLNLQQESLTVTQFYTKHKAIWDELQDYLPQRSCVCGENRVLLDYFQQEQIMHFLMSLSDSYNQIKSHVLLMNPLPPMNRVFSMVLQEEKQREIAARSADLNSAFAAQATNSGKSGKKDRDCCINNYCLC